MTPAEIRIRFANLRDELARRHLSEMQALDRQEDAAFAALARATEGNTK